MAVGVIDLFEVIQIEQQQGPVLCWRVASESACSSCLCNVRFASVVRLSCVPDGQALLRRICDR